jgi:hypothetical protein
MREAQQTASIRTAKKMWFRLFPVQNSIAQQERARDKSGNTADFTVDKVEELERIARSPLQAGMRPNFKIHSFNAVWILEPR